MTTQTKKFVKGAMILSIAGLIAKIISAFYRIPLANFTGELGSGYYTTVFPTFALLISASLIGIPNAVSKLVSERIANNKYYEAHKIFEYSMIIISLIGFIVSLVMLVGADWLIQLLGWEQGTKYTIIGLAIAPIFISIAGAFKGYFQGMEIMEPVAITQILENLVKVFIGISLTYILVHMDYGIPKAVGGAALGTSCGFVVSALFIILYYLRKRKEILNNLNKSKDNNSIVQFSYIAKKIIIIAIPITIGSAAYSIMNFIDTATVYIRLASIGVDKSTATSMMGQNGMAFTIVNVPLTISLALMISIVPAVAAAVAKKDRKELNSKIALAIRFALLLALPAAAGLCLLAEPIMKLLYRSNYMGYEYLILYGFCLIFMILGQALASILQGIGKYYFPLFSLLISVIVKIIINYSLVASSLQVKGAVIGSIMYYIVFVLFNYLAVKKYTKIKLNIFNTVIKPLFATCVMGTIVWLSYKLFYGVLGSNTISTVFSVLIGMLIYVIMLLITKALYEDDFGFIPNSDKIIKKLKRRNLINE